MKKNIDKYLLTVGKQILNAIQLTNFQLENVFFM